MTSTAPSKSRPLRIARRYRLVELVGSGGTAQVWRAYDERLRRQVAVKLLDDTGAGSVRCEARAIARLTDPHIAHVFDCGVHEGLPYLVLELVDGRSLSAVLREQGLTWGAAVLCTAQIASALAAAHERGVVHRDVTPANVMLTTTGVKVIDFGLAAGLGQPEIDSDGVLRGTPAYVAPERLRNQPVTPAGDVYSLGVLLYRALAGRLPWSADTARELSHRQLTTPPEALPTIDVLPPEVAKLCLECLAVDPKRRPDAKWIADVLRSAAPSGAEAELRRLANASPDEATLPLPPPTSPLHGPPDAWSRRARPLAAVAAVSCLAALAASATGLSMASDDPPPTVVADPPHPPTCQAAFELVSQEQHQLQTAITVTDHSGGRPSGWRMSVRLPKVQLIDTEHGWRATNGVLTSPRQPELRPRASARLTFTAQHGGAIALPTYIRVDDQACDVTIIGVTTNPSTPPSTAVGESSDETTAAHANNGNAALGYRDANPGVSETQPPGQRKKRTGSAR